MTDQIFDDRARAFVEARDKLADAEALKGQHHRAVLEDRAVPDELPAEYWSLIAEAAVLAQLARAEAAVGFLAGNFAVQSASKIQRRERRRIREEVRAKVNETRRLLEPAEGVTTEHHWRHGQIVRLTEGDFAGRSGQILETHLTQNEPPMADVQLHPPGWPHNPAEPIVLTVREDQLEAADL